MKEKVVVTPVAEGAAVNNEPAIDVDGYMEGSDGIEVFASQCLPAKLDMQLPEQGVKEKATTVRSLLLAEISEARNNKNVELLLKLERRFYTMEEDGECGDLQGVSAELEAILAGPPPGSPSELRRWEFLTAEEKRLREKSCMLKACGSLLRR